MNNQEAPIKDIDFKVSKPYITFGLHYDEVDVNFYNFDLRDNFKDYHFNFNKTYEVLPEIKNADTILQFTLPYEQDLEKQTYLLLNIWGNETLWRIHATQTIYYQNKVALQFDCKRDFFNEYFSLKRNEFKLENVYLLRSNIMKPSLENLRICSNACLNDTTPKQVILSNSNRGKKLITSQEFDNIKYWEIATTNTEVVINTLKNILSQFTNSFLERFFNLVKNLKSISDVYLRYIPHSLGYDRVFVKNAGWITVDYYNYRWTVNGSVISKPNSSGNNWYIDARNHASNYTSYSNSYGINNKLFRFEKYGDKYWVFKPIELKESSISGSYSKNPCDDRPNTNNCGYSSEQRLSYCNEADVWDPPPAMFFTWYETPKARFCGTHTIQWTNTFSYKYLSTSIQECIKQSNKEFGGNGGFREPIDINSGTIYNNLEPKSIFIKVFKQENYLKQLSKIYGVKENLVIDAYNQTITDFLTLLRNRLGVNISEVSLDNATIQYFDSFAFSNFKIYDDNGNSTGYSQNLLELKFAKRVTPKQFKIYNAMSLTSHYEATHIKDFIVGNSIGVFNVDRTKDYEVLNRDTGEQIVFPTELSEILETGNITIEKKELSEIGQGQLELEKVRALLELRDKQGDLLTKTKMNRVNRDADYQKQHIIDSANIERDSKIANLVGTIVGAVGGGILSGGAFPGVSRGAYLGNRVASNITSIGSNIQHRDLNVKKLEFKTKNEVADLWDDNEMSKKFKNEQFDLENYFNMKVSGHLVNTNTIKFPWIDKKRALYLLRLSFGSKDKINYEREVFGDFINQYVDIDKSKLLGRSFILIDTNKSDVLDFPGLNAIAQEIIKRLLNKGIFIHNPSKKSSGITRVW